MQRQISNWWLILLWIPVLALVLGLVAGCAASGSTERIDMPRPSHDDLERLVAQELATDSRFDSFGAAHSADASQVAAGFRPVLADVSAIDCRAAPAQSLDCTLEVVMRFPGLDGRESRTYWERRLRQVEGNWQVIGLTQP